MCQVFVSFSLSKTEFPFCKEKACTVSGFQCQNGAAVICTGPELLHRTQVAAQKEMSQKSCKVSNLTLTVRGHQVRMTPTADGEWLPQSWQPLLKSPHGYPKILALTFPAAFGESRVQRA